NADDEEEPDHERDVIEPGEDVLRAEPDPLPRRVRRSPEIDRRRRLGRDRLEPAAVAPRDRDDDLRPRGRDPLEADRAGQAGGAAAERALRERAVLRIDDAHAA